MGIITSAGWLQLKVAELDANGGLSVSLALAVMVVQITLYISRRVEPEPNGMRFG